MTVELTTEELEALNYFLSIYGIRRVPPSLREAALTGHMKIERACTAALEPRVRDAERTRGGDPGDLR